MFREEKLGKKKEKKSDKKKIDKKTYNKALAKLQVDLVSLQAWIVEKGLRVVVIFEGRDAAGKGGVIKRITQRLNPRVCRIVALSTPTEKEKSQWYFQRYVAHLPGAGEMVLYDRSWGIRHKSTASSSATSVPSPTTTPSASAWPTSPPTA